MGRNLQLFDLWYTPFYTTFCRKCSVKLRKHACGGWWQTTRRRLGWTFLSGSRSSGRPRGRTSWRKCSWTRTGTRTPSNLSCMSSSQMWNHQMNQDHDVTMMRGFCSFVYPSHAWRRNSSQLWRWLSQRRKPWPCGLMSNGFQSKRWSKTSSGLRFSANRKDKCSQNCLVVT